MIVYVDISETSFPKDKIVVLGLVSIQDSDLES